MSRDKVLAYFWPETDTDHARNNLKQSLFIMRRALGEDVLTSAGSFLRIDAARLTVDAWEFEVGLDRRALAAAVALYQGPFLDGFYVSSLPEFERWVEAERGRLARRYQEAMEALAAGAAAAGDTHAAVMWWRRVVDHDPLSSRSALALMQALVADGDRADALKYAELHESFLRAELGVDPDTGERTFVQQLRQFAFRHGYPRPREHPKSARRPSHGPAA
ncbi:MAG: BTAD domain-containing putative transcriptional regulator [Gemmatimonadales bacterium]